MRYRDLTTKIDWNNLTELAEKLAEPGSGPGGVFESEWRIVDHSLTLLVETHDWEGIIRLREMFTFLVTGDTTGGLPIVQRINTEAIKAAEHLGDAGLVANFRHDEGHNLHRQGYHKRSIEAFEEAAVLYREVGSDFRALESFYMTALCHRALGNRSLARQILEEVLDEVGDENPWRANPLQVMAWLVQDEGQLDEAERLLRKALVLYEQYEGPDSMLVLQTLADLGEVLGFQGRHSEAVEVFQRALNIISKFPGQVDRQEARTKLKFAEVLIRGTEYEQALRFLDEADDRIRAYGHYYDLLWRIEMARALIYLRQRHWRLAIQKARVVLGYRRQLDLSSSLLVKQLVSRLFMGTGLPR